MNRLKIVEYKEEHINKIEFREYDVKFGFASDKNCLEMAKVMLQLGNPYTIFLNDKILSILTVHKLWDGVGEAFQIPSIYAKEYSTIFARAAKKILNNYIKTLVLHRVQTTTQNDSEHIRWMKFLGFTLEGMLKKYTMNKEDYLQWGKIVKENL